MTAVCTWFSNKKNINYINIKKERREMCLTLHNLFSIFFCVFEFVKIINITKKQFFIKIWLHALAIIFNLKKNFNVLFDDNIFFWRSYNNHQQTWVIFINSIDFIAQ